MAGKMMRRHRQLCRRAMRAPYAIDIADIAAMICRRDAARQRLSSLKYQMLLILWRRALLLMRAVMLITPYMR